MSTRSRPPEQLGPADGTDRAPPRAPGRPRLEAAIPARQPRRVPARPRPPAPPGGTLLLAAVLLAAGCGGRGGEPPVRAAAAGGPAPLGAAGIAALTDDRPPTGLPPAPPPDAVADRVLDGLLAGQPGALPAGRWTAEQTGGALAATARLVAATRADPAHLCGPPSGDPAAAHATPDLSRWLAEPANTEARAAIETTISASGTTGGCGPLSWVGPGVVPGPQTWSLTPSASGSGLDVAWAGSFGYALAGPDGAPEPWGQRAAARYRLAEHGGQWLLDSWDGASWRVAQGWPRDVEVPDGYLPAPEVPGADPEALDAVRGAAAAWVAAPASVLTIEQAQTGAGAAGGEAVTSTATAAPGRGDAAGRAAGRETLWLDGGRRVLSRDGDGGKRWSGRDAAAPAEWGVSTPLSPFGAVALLADADAAAASRCPDGLAAARCWTAAVSTAAPGARLSADTALAHRAGLPWLVLNAGTDDAGRPVFVRVEQTATAFGRPHATLISTARFTGYPGSAPPPVPLTGPDAVAPAEDVLQ